MCQNVLMAEDIAVFVLLYGNRKRQIKFSLSVDVYQTAVSIVKRINFKSQFLNRLWTVTMTGVVRTTFAHACAVQAPGLGVLDRGF